MPPPLWELTLIGALYAGFFLYSHIMYLKVSAACYCGTFDQYVYKWTYFCFIVALILMKIYSQSWSSECINYLFIHLVQHMLQLCT